MLDDEDPMEFPIKTEQLTISSYLPCEHRTIGGEPHGVWPKIKAVPLILIPGSSDNSESDSAYPPGTDFVSERYADNSDSGTDFASTGDSSPTFG